MATVRHYQRMDREQLRLELGPVLAVLIEGLVERFRADEDDRGASFSLVTAVNPTTMEQMAARRQETLTALAEVIALEAVVYPLVKGGDNPAEKICIGRGRRNDIVLDDQAVSTIHSYVEVDDERGCCLAQDAGSSNGTHLNGRLLTGPEATRLRTGDCLRIGPRVFYYVKVSKLFDLLDYMVHEA